MLSEPPPSESPWKFQPRRWLDYRRKRFWGVLLVLIYVLAGFFLLPPVLQSRIVAAAQKELGRPVTLDRVRVNPLVLSVGLSGFRVKEKDGAPLLGFDDLYVRLSPDSLLHWAWSFGDIRLDGLKSDLVRYGPGDTNIGRLIQSIPAKEPAKPAKDEAGTRLIIHHLTLLNAIATFTDHVPSTPFTTQIGPVNAQIDSFSTLPDKTGHQHIVIDLEKGARLEWTSQSSLGPLTSTGHVKAKGPYLPLIARYFGDAYKLAVPAGTVEAELDFRLEQRSGGELAASIDHLGLVLKDLAVQEKDAAAPFLSLPQLRLAGGHLSWPEREAGADSLSIEGLSLALRREPDGRIAPMPPSSEPAPSAPAEKADWSFSLGKAEIKNAKARFEDHAIPDGGKIEIASIDLTADSLSNKPDAAFPFSLAVGVAPGGTAKLQGKLSALPSIALDAKLTLADLPLAIIQPYLHDLAKLTIQDGKLDGEGDVKLKDPDGLKIVGHGEVRALKLKDEIEQSPVVAWESLGVDRYVYRQSANELSLSQVTLNGPYLRFQVAKDHSTNFSHILVPAAPAKQAAAAAPANSKAPPPMKISVGKIAVATGSADYGDLSLPLPFATHITNLQGHISTLTSSAASASGVSLQGQVDQYGEVNIFGQVNPFQATKGMKLNVVFRNVEFPGLSPYTVKFAGRRVAKGRLDLESKYDVDGGKLTGSNRVVIRDMELGEKVDVAGAMDLPLDLLISLLKDDEGKIDLDIPISGDVSDPQFDFGSVVAKEVADLLGDIIASPFRALAGLFGGGGEALDHIDFAPGRAVLEPPEKEKILHVADLLQKRPKVDLVVAGVIDQQADRQKLQRDALDSEMAKELGDHDMVGRQRRYLEGLFEKRISKDQLAALRQPFAQSGDDDPGYIAALRREVAKTEPIDEAGLANLAQSRGKAVADALKQVPGFDPKRVTLGGAKEVKSEDDYHIPLKLEIADSGAKR